MGRRNDIDWEMVQKLYIANQLTVREIAAKCGIGASSVTLKAKNQGWQRNLDAAIRERTKAKIATIDSQALIEQTAQQSVQQSVQTQISAIEYAATVNAEVIKRHRVAIKVSNENTAQLEAMFSEFSSKAEDLNDVMKLSQIHKLISDAKAKMIEKERQAHNITDDDLDAGAQDEPKEIIVQLVGVNGR